MPARSTRGIPVCQRGQDGDVGSAAALGPTREGAGPRLAMSFTSPVAETSHPQAGELGTALLGEWEETGRTLTDETCCVDSAALASGNEDYAISIVAFPSHVLG